MIKPWSSCLCLSLPQMDGLVRVNGEATEDLPGSTSPASPQLSPQEIEDVTSKQTEKDVPSEETVKHQETTEHPAPPHTERSSTSSGSAISSLIGGRNCIIKTTIVTELTQTVVEPHHPDIQNNGQVILQVMCQRTVPVFIYIPADHQFSEGSVCFLTSWQTLVPVLICALGAQWKSVVLKWKCCVYGNILHLRHENQVSVHSLWRKMKPWRWAINKHRHY